MLHWLRAVIVAPRRDIMRRARNADWYRWVNYYGFVWGDLHYQVGGCYAGYAAYIAHAANQVSIKIRLGQEQQHAEVCLACILSIGDLICS